MSRFSGGGSTRGGDWNLDCKVYIGELGHGCSREELEEVFKEYGHLLNVWVARRPPGFAFVEFEDPRDAEDAVQALDGSRINGHRVRVEMSSGRSRRGRRGGGPPRGGQRGYRDYGYRGRNDRRRSGSDDSRGRRSRTRSPKRKSRSPMGRRSSRSPARRSPSPSRKSRSPVARRTSRSPTSRSPSPK